MIYACKRTLYWPLKSSLFIHKIILFRNQKEEKKHLSNLRPKRYFTTKMEVVISKLAYCKLFLHLSKYPHSSCNGLLLSKIGGDKKKANYVECVPLFHSSLSLAPSLEIALFQIDSYCKLNDLEITGYYQATENIHDNQ